MAENKNSFSNVLEALQNTEKLFPPRYLTSFSDMSAEELAELKKVWPRIPLNRKISLMEDIEDLAESDPLTNFEEMAYYNLNDSDPEVRVLAIRLLWDSEDLTLADRLIQMMQTDADPRVQAAAASGLGSYVYQGELEEIPDALLEKIVAALLDTHKSSPHSLVRKYSLESLGYSSNAEVPGLILAAYQSDNPSLIASALFAMGRSADEQYKMQVISNLHHTQSDIQLEAVRAAGELNLKEVRDELLDMVDSGDLDEEVFYGAIWSLSQIGGEGVQAKFEEVMESDIDDDLMDFMENAMDNLAFNEGMEDFGLFKFDEDSDLDANEEDV